MKKALPVQAVVLIFVLGLGIMLYPAVANYLNAQSQTVAIDQYEEAARANTAYYEGLLEQAQAFNEGVLKRGTLAVMTEAEKAEYKNRGFVRTFCKKVSRSQSLVTLQRPLPVTRIFLPGFSSCSSRVTVWPCSSAAPAPSARPRPRPQRSDVP